MDQAAEGLRTRLPAADLAAEDGREHQRRAEGDRLIFHTLKGVGPENRPAPAEFDQFVASLEATNVDGAVAVSRELRALQAQQVTTPSVAAGHAAAEGAIPAAQPAVAQPAAPMAPAAAPLAPTPASVRWRALSRGVGAGESGRTCPGTWPAH